MCVSAVCVLFVVVACFELPDKSVSGAKIYEDQNCVKKIMFAKLASVFHLNRTDVQINNGVVVVDIAVVVVKVFVNVVNNNHRTNMMLGIQFHLKYRHTC